MMDRAATLPRRGPVAIIATVVVALAVWQLVIVFVQPRAYLIPPPARVGSVFISHWRDLLEHTAVTAGAALLGCAIAVVLGIAVGALVHRSSIANRVVWPAVLFLQITPQVAIAPLLVVWLGLGLGMKLVLITLIAFFPVVVNAHAGFSSLSPEADELATSMRATSLQRFHDFELPHALPDIFSGVKLAVTFSIVGAVIAEFIGSSSGLGFYVISANGMLDAAAAFAGLFCLTGLGGVFYWTIGLIERRTVGWHPSVRIPEFAIGPSSGGL